MSYCIHKKFITYKVPYGTLHFHELQCNRITANLKVRSDNEIRYMSIGARNFVYQVREIYENLLREFIGT
jgi:hypothetical protein